MTRTIHLAWVLFASACADRTVDRATDIGGDAADTGSSTSDDAGGNGTSAGVDPTEGDTGTPSCASAPCGPLNCGPHGTACGDMWGITECIDGECGPRFSGCFDGTGSAPKSCSEICTILDEEAVCVPGACRGTTAYGWAEEYYAACAESVKLEYAIVPLDVGCDDPIDFTDPSSALVQCCCDFPGN